MKKLKNLFTWTPKSNWIAGLIIFGLIWSCDKKDLSPGTDNNAIFMSFSTNGQTLPTAIDNTSKEIKLELKHSANLSQLVPAFEVPPGYSVFANGVKQVSGSSFVDLSQPVTYELRNEQNVPTKWKVSGTQLACKIIIDASHDGGVWWFPQSESTGFDANQYHQGQAMAKLLRNKGFEVTELGRGKELSEEMFFGNYIVIRVAGFEPYTSKEIAVYTNLLNRGMNLAFFTDHKKYDPTDELGDLLGLQFKGMAIGRIEDFTTDEITANMKSLDYVAGSVIMNDVSDPNFQILGRLRSQDYADLNFNGVQDPNEPTASPVMGILKYPKSKIFFIGDTNGLEVQSQPFIDNLITWMGSCTLE